MSDLIGQPVPDVRLTGPEGAVRVRDLVAGKALVLYFYPRDETPGCTAEACSFRDQYEDFLAAGADVIGVSRDSAESHQKFRAHHRLPFRLFTDPGGEAARAFGIKKTFGLIEGRVTFVIDASGVVRHRFESQLRVHKHVTDALTLVKSLSPAR